MTFITVSNFEKLKLINRLNFAVFGVLKNFTKKYFWKKMKFGIFEPKGENYPNTCNFMQSNFEIFCEKYIFLKISKFFELKMNTF